jgi:hypothetical protein
MHGRQLVEQLWVNQLQTWLVQLSADTHRQDTTNDQHRETEEQIQRTNIFVVSCKDPTTPARGGVVIVMGMIIMMVKYGAHGFVLLLQKFNYLNQLLRAACTAAGCTKSPDWFDQLFFV